MRTLERRVQFRESEGWTTWRPVVHMNPEIHAGLDALLVADGGWAKKVTVHLRAGDKAQFRRKRRYRAL